MGFRTVVVLSNDFSFDWGKDPVLGKKIMDAASCIGCIPGRWPDFQYGSVVEVAHSDLQTLMLLDGYTGKPITHGHWHRNQTHDEKHLGLLKGMADKMGYTISKKRTKSVARAASSEGAVK